MDRVDFLLCAVIRPGTQTANNMSPVDIRRREQILLSNKKKLENSHIFVSPTRLVVHNVPKSFNNNRLHDVCLKAVGDKSAKLKEVLLLCCS